MFVMLNPVQWKAWVIFAQESERGEGLQMNDGPGVYDGH